MPNGAGDVKALHEVGGDTHPGENLAQSFAGQANGLCGAAVPGCLCLLTGLHTGDVHIRVDVTGTAPELGNRWEEAVEVSFWPGPGGASLFDWDSNLIVDLGLREEDYRVRYCARGMEAGRQLYTGEGNPVDFYALYFWPAPPAPDRVLRQTSDTAAYWHTAWPEMRTPSLRDDGQRPVTSRRGHPAALACRALGIQVPVDRGTAATGLGESVALKLGVLAIGGDTGEADETGLHGLRHVSQCLKTVS